MKRIVKWIAILVGLYFVITTLWFGYDDIDSEKGVFKFYWSGFRGLTKEDKFGFGFKINEPVNTKLDGLDGPYVFANTSFYVNDKNEFHQQKIDSTKEIIVNTSCKQLPYFNVYLKDSIGIENDTYEMPEKIVAISDIEGNFDGFYSFLVSNKVIDRKGNWIFGKGHLVLNGDFFDRGKQVSQVLWLIYHLENQALDSGGKVHFILGNHEIMNLYGDVSYNDFKYMEVAKRISKQNDWDKGLRNLYSDKSELGKWLRSKNVVHKIGNVIFVHGGLNSLHVTGKYSIKELNSISRKYYGIYPSEKSVLDKRDRLLISSIDSPFWDRRLNFDWKYKIMFKINGIDASATTPKELNTILNYYEAEEIVIGHSVVDDITADYGGKVIKIDVKHGQTIKSGKTKGILIENKVVYKIDDVGNKIKLVSS